MHTEKQADYTKTVLTIITGLMVIFLFIGLQKQNWMVELTFVAAFLGVLALISSGATKLIHVGWMKLAWLLGLIVPNIILGIIFFLILYPLSLLAKLFSNKDLLDIRSTPLSTFKEVSRKFDKQYFEKSW